MAVKEVVVVVVVVVVVGKVEGDTCMAEESTAAVLPLLSSMERSQTRWTETAPGDKGGRVAAASCMAAEPCIVGQVSMVVLRVGPSLSSGATTALGEEEGSKPIDVGV